MSIIDGVTGFIFLRELTYLVHRFLKRRQAIPQMVKRVSKEAFSLTSLKPPATLIGQNWIATLEMSKAMPHVGVAR